MRQSQYFDWSDVNRTSLCDRIELDDRVLQVGPIADWMLLNEIIDSCGRRIKEVYYISTCLYSLLFSWTQLQINI